MEIIIEVCACGKMLMPVIKNQKQIGLTHSPEDEDWHFEFLGTYRAAAQPLQPSLDKHWYEIKDLMVAAMDKNITPEDWVNICKGLGYSVSRAQPSLEEKKDDIASSINTDVSSVASHNSTDNNSIQ